MTVRVYRSTDAGAPQLSGEIGKLIPIMRAVLKDGYALPSISSITRSGSTVTVTFVSAHGMVSYGNFVTIAGVNQAEYNGEFAVTILNTTQITYTIAGTPATPATGSYTAKKGGSGWTIPYTGTNLEVYQQGAGNGRLIRFDDTAALDARVVGYESMTDLNTGTGPFPTTAQLSGGGYFRKSAAASTAVRDWIVIATQTAFYLWINSASATTSAKVYFFGDFVSYTPSDIFNTILIAATTAGGAQGAHDVTVNIGTAGAGHFIARAATQTGTSITAGKHINAAASRGAATIGSNGEAYPGQRGLSMSKVHIHEPTAIIVRGEMPGILAPLHALPLAHLDTFQGVGGYTGKRFLALSHNSSGQSFFEISNTW